MLANVWPGCLDSGGDHPEEEVVDRDKDPHDSARRMLRGGTFATPTPTIRSSQRTDSRSTEPLLFVDLRMVRTCD
jgi:hypothetical protein